MDTLAAYNKRPFVSYIDLSKASLVHTMGKYEDAKQMLHTVEGSVKAAPEREALWFYLQHHTMAVIGHTMDQEEPLGEFQSFVDKYFTDMQPKAIRMFYYLLLICTRESRHMREGKDEVYKKYPLISSFHQCKVQDKDHDDAISAITHNAPDITLGEYVNFLVDTFSIAQYESGYGGSSWEAVAKPLRDFVYGKLTPEIFMDTAFTLAHNGGPIFNKNMLYENFSEYELVKILNIQRSGQIPQFVFHNEAHQFVSSKMIAYVRKFAHLSGDFSGFVNWKEVKDIHGQIVYHDKIAMQGVKESDANIIVELKKNADVIKTVKKAEKMKQNQERIFSYNVGFVKHSLNPALHAAASLVISLVAESEFLFIRATTFVRLPKVLRTSSNSS